MIIIIECEFWSVWQKYAFRMDFVAVSIYLLVERYLVESESVKYLVLIGIECEDVYAVTNVCPLN